MMQDPINLGDHRRRLGGLHARDQCQLISILKPPQDRNDLISSLVLPPDRFDHAKPLPSLKVETRFAHPLRPVNS